MSLDTNPQLPADWDTSKVIPGELVDPQEPVDFDDEDDIAPGIVTVFEPRTPVIRQVGSAAMVAASITGRAAGLTARGGWIGSCWLGRGLRSGSRWFAHGVRSVSYLGYRYLRTHDYQEAVGGITSSTDWRRNTEERHRRWKWLGIGTGVTALLNATGWWALVKYAEMTALDFSWAIPPAATATILGSIITLYGRYRLENPGLAPEQIVADEDQDDGEEPFPLAWCTSPGQVAECVSRAFAYEGIGTRRVDIVGHRPWGWEIDVVLKGSKVGKVNAVADDLDAHFNIKTGGTLIDPDPQEAAHLVLRLVTANPFEDMAKPAVHAPNSLDISDPHNLGRRMDGRVFDLVLEGLRILAIGVSGAAKTTGVLRDLAEIITACHNAIALDMDPVKDGLREFDGAMATPPIRGNRECEKWLGYLVKMAKGRNSVRNRLGMGDTWVATADHPAIFPFVDEFIFLSQKAKELFIELLRIGKQSGIYPIAAGQDATSDSMGDAVADSFTLRIMLAARHADIPLVLGQGAIAAGFRPDRLVPAQTKDIRNDAGQSYIKGPGLDRPLLYGWNEYSSDSIKRAVAERKSAGRPWFDRDTLAAAGLLHLADGGSGERVSGDRQIASDAAAVMANDGVTRIRTEALAEALSEHDPDAYGGLTAAGLRKLLKDAGAGSPVPIGDLDGFINPRGYKIDALTVL
jgi:S-DNA-T family DNA segregation ATPase FtsK/SpoIIIE